MTKLNTRALIKTAAIVLAVVLPVTISSCGKNEVEVSKKSDEKNQSKTSETVKTEAKGSPGKELFYARSKENNVACADCHGDGTNSQNSLTKYFSNIAGANKRTSTYHGKFQGADVASNAGGATVCWESYMKMKTPLTPEQIASLNEFYSGLTGSNTVEEVKYETIALPEPNKAKLKEAQKRISALTGDAAAGEIKFNDACGMCHGKNKTAKKVPDLFDDFDGNVKSITYNVRFGDGAMPFFNQSVLPDQDVANIAAYILKRNEK
jgi:mono/diheme cytochrome c family protein